MKIAFFDTKPYDKPSFDRFGAENDIRFKYFETKLNEDTVDLAAGYDGVCVFVNDTVNAAVIDRLCELGVGNQGYRSSLRGIQQRRPQARARKDPRHARSRLLSLCGGGAHHGNAPDLDPPYS